MFLLAKLHRYRKEIWARRRSSTSWDWNRYKKYGELWFCTTRQLCSATCVELWTFQALVRVKLNFNGPFFNAYFYRPFLNGNELFSKCPPKCLQDETLTDSIQYGKYQTGKMENRKKMLTSIMIYLKPEHKSYSIEQLEYESTQFFSDVGGAAGLLLGVSFTSLFGMIGPVDQKWLLSHLSGPSPVRIGSGSGYFDNLEKTS